MEPGPNAEDFTRSELRQRIEQTSANLGIDFPVEGQSDDEDIFDDMDKMINMNETKEEKIKHNRSNALLEIRSTHSKDTHKGFVIDEETDMARKRREKKYSETSQKYAKLGGMLVGPPGTNNGVLDPDIDIHEINALAGHGLVWLSWDLQNWHWFLGPAQ